MMRPLERDAGECLFFASLAIFTVLTYAANITVLVGVLQPLSYGALAMLALAFLARIRSYSAVEALILALFTVISLYQLVVAKNYSLVKYALLLAGMKGISFDRCIRFDVCVRLICGLGLVLLSMVGAAEDVVVLDSVRGLRHSFGFPNPNQLGMAVLIISLEALYLQRNKIRWWSMAFIAIMVSWTSVVTDSRSTVLIVIIAMAFCLFRRTALSGLEGSRLLRFVVSNSAIVLFVLTWVMYLLYVQGNPLAVSFDGFSTGRLARIQLFATFFNPSLLGQNLEVADASLDTAYAYMVYGYGMALTIVFLLSFRALERRLFDTGNHVLMIILFCLALYGLSERLWLFPEYDGLMLAFGILLYGDGGRAGHPVGERSHARGSFSLSDH